MQNAISTVELTIPTGQTSKDIRGITILEYFQYLKKAHSVPEQPYTEQLPNVAFGPRAAYLPRKDSFHRFTDS